MEKMNDFYFHPTQIGYITECVEPINGVITIRDSVLYFDNDPELKALPVEMEQGGYGVLSRDLFEQDKVSFRNAGKPVSSLNLYQGKYESLNSRENIRKLFVQIATGEIDELKYYIVYHNNNLLGVVSLHRIIHQISDLQRKEIAGSRDMRQKILQNNLIENPLFKIHADIQWAHDLGGDHYYTSRITESLSMIACFDVEGDQMTASMLTMVIDSYFKTRERLHDLDKEDVEKLLLGLNALLLEEIPDERAVKGLFLFIQKDESRVSLYNFGYPAPFLILSEEAKIRARLVPPQYEPMGKEDIVIFRDVPFSCRIANLRNIFIYSDGMENCLNPFGEKFGIERIKSCLVKHYRELGFEFSTILKAELDQFRSSAPLFDSISTMVVSFS